MTDWDNVKLTATKHVAWIRIDFDDDGTPMYMGEHLIEFRPGYWVHPWNWELQLQQLEGCALCGQPPLGAAAADGRALCHTNVRDCYHRWTVWGERPGTPPVPGKVGAER